MFLTENYAALDILKHYLHVGSSNEDNHDLTLQPYILFGSSFPKDKEYTQVTIVFSNSVQLTLFQTCLYSIIIRVNVMPRCACASKVYIVGGLLVCVFVCVFHLYIWWSVIATRGASRDTKSCFLTFRFAVLQKKASFSSYANFTHPEGSYGCLLKI